MLKQLAADHAVAVAVVTTEGDTGLLIREARISEKVRTITIGTENRLRVEVSCVSTSDCRS